MWKCYLVLCSDWLADDDLTDVIELIPIFILVIHITEKRLEFGATRNGHIQSFGCEK